MATHMSGHESSQTKPATITAPIGGRVERVAVASGTRVERGDLLLVLAPADAST